MRDGLVWLSLALTVVGLVFNFRCSQMAVIPVEEKESVAI